MGTIIGDTGPALGLGGDGGLMLGSGLSDGGCAVSWGNPELHCSKMLQRLSMAWSWALQIISGKYFMAHKSSCIAWVTLSSIMINGWVRW